MILLRTTTLSPHTAAFARRLATETGERLCLVVDERRQSVDAGGFDKIGFTAASCRARGLHCPPDFGWRCGDYGFYLARERHPDETFFWLIEYDVRLTTPDLNDFFGRFSGAHDVDLIAADYREADRHWYWNHTMAARGQGVWRMLFPVVRLSARAIDALLAQRRAHGHRVLRRANWPNDESFVATVLTRAGMKCVDLNAFGPGLYDRSSFAFDGPFDGAQLDEHAPPLRVFHPVLFGEDLRRKRERMVRQNEEGIVARLKRRVIHALNQRTAA